MIETRLLRNALALAEHRNFARAARVLNISQPTLTRSIQTLENQIGARLFDRKTRTVLPTPVGEEMLKHARLVVASSRALEDGIQQFQGLKQGSLAIGIGPYAASILLGHALGCFNRQHPDVRVTAMVDDWINLPRRLKEREFDFVLMETSQLHADQDLEVIPLLPHQGFFFCNGAHPALKLKALSMQHLADYPFVLPRLPQRLLDLFGSLFMPTGDDRSVVDRLSIIQSNDVLLIRNTVANSEALGVATYGMITEDLQNNRFAALPIRVPELRTAYGIVTRKGLSLSPAAYVLQDILLELNASQSVQDARFVEALC
ncbi:MAG: LysR family transcriptional regulator [Gammaproteobacteria bacterium]|jgi:DNA-binding transcriptional LysR family regulator